jgi:hypothetical protein
MSDYYNDDALYCKCCKFTAKNNFLYNRHITSNKHIRNSTMGGKYSCDICAKIFSSPQSLCNHKKQCGQQINNLNNDKYYKDMINVKDEQINFLKEQLEYFQKQNETLQNQIINLQNNNIQQTQQITQPQNIIVNNQLPPVEKKKKRITITQSNYKNNIPKIIKEPITIENAIKDYNKLVDHKIFFNDTDYDHFSYESNFYKIYNDFMNEYDEENFFMFLGKNENEPTSIYYYGKKYDSKYNIINDSNTEWYSCDYKFIDKLFINYYYSKLMNKMANWWENDCGGMNNSSHQNKLLICDIQTNIMAFKDKLNKNKYYESIYNKSGKLNSKK